jgi:formylglycine-generating enzyme required for sulfatase activity/serine/threonine protein kinase
MSIPIALFKFAARAGLNAVGFGVAGDFAVEVLPSIVRDVWGWWGKDRSEAELRSELQVVAQLSDPAARQAAAEAVAAEANGHPEALQLKLVSYLAQVPAVVRQTQRRPADPSGRTVSASLLLHKPDDLLPLFPTRLPRFQAGDRAPGFPDWTLEDLLGVGGFGEVWRATNPHLPAVALKFCLDSAAARTLRNEADLLGRVATQGRHPGIVALLDTALANEPPCLKYEYVPGGDLACLIHQWHQQATPHLVEQASHLMCDLAGIVGFAHHLSPPIVHRDLKPANILLQAIEPGRIHLRVADFGIGGVATRRAREETSTVTSRGQFLTAALRGSCTPLYASHQQMHGEDPDPRDDVYSLGVIWLQVLTGDLTTGATPDWRDELAERHVPDEVVALMAACLSSRPEKRPSDAGILAEKVGALIKRNGAATTQPGASGATTGVFSVGGAPPTAWPSDDPSRVQVKEYALSAIDLVIEAEPAIAVETPGLPPVPEDILDLEGRLGGLDRALDQLEHDTHPALRSARQAVDDSERQARNLEADLQANSPPLEPGQREALARAVARDPRGPVTPLLDLAPQASTRVLLPLIHRLRNAERARLAQESARNQYAELRRKEVDSLRREREEVLARLVSRQSEDLQLVLRAFFEKVGRFDEFPLEEWMELEGLLEQRRCRLNAKQLLSRAEQAFEVWRQFGDVVPPADVVNSLGMRLILVRPGKFLMGSPAEEKGRRQDEGPLHEVTLTRPFYLAMCPVTQEQYHTVMGVNPSYFARTGGGREKVAGLDTRTFPVEGVTWDDAVTFCTRLSERPSERKAGRTYRLPTEAEWEYACRAGTGTPFYAGESLASVQANFNGQNPAGSAARGPSLQRPAAVGGYPPNPWGFHDLLGNIWEWCHDFYAERAYPAGPVSDPTGPLSGSGHVLRGGAWDVGGDLCRCSTRNVYRPGWDRCFGFRVVLVLEPRKG